MPPADVRPATNVTPPRPPALRAAFLNEWSIDGTNTVRGGLLPAAPEGAPAAPDGAPSRQLFLLQRKRGKHGAGLGKTTGWIHRSSLKKAGVSMLGGVTYERIDDDGLHVRAQDGTPTTLAVDTVVVCAGQVSNAPLEAPLAQAGLTVFKVGGAHLAAELDAKRAIDQAMRLAVQVETASADKMDEYLAPLGMSGWLFQKVASKSA